MKFKVLSFLLVLMIALPANAVNCEKKPCHKKCIASQPDYIQTQCRCEKRKKVYYHTWGSKTGVPEYDPACDGSVEQYIIKYCEAKRIYDQKFLNYTDPYIPNTYTPSYDQNCDGTYEQYLENIKELKKIQAINNAADALRQPIQVNHTIYGQMNHNINGTIRTNNYYYGY